MAEGAGLENRCTRKGIVGSNPTLSAPAITITYDLRHARPVAPRIPSSRFRIKNSRIRPKSFSHKQLHLFAMMVGRDEHH